jgi:hypothetical protein
MTPTAVELKSKRADGQITGLAGEFFVAAELLKRGMQTSVTFGNAKAIDLLAVHPDTHRMYTVQVKAIRRKNYFPISHAKIRAQHIYVFVLLNKPGDAVQYFIVPGAVLSTEPERFTKWFIDPKFPGIHPKTLQEQGFAEAWHFFDEPKL